MALSVHLPVVILDMFFLWLVFPIFPKYAKVAMATLAPLLSIAKVLTSLYLMGRVMFLSAPSQYSPTLFEGIDIKLAGV